MNRAAPMRALGGLLLISALAGCANAPVAQRGGPPSTSASAPPSSSSPSSPPSSGSPSPSGSSAPGAPGLPVPGVRVPAAQLDVSGVTKGAPSSVWTSDGGRTLHIVGSERACSTLHADVLEQGPQQVRIGMAVTLLRTLAACPMTVAPQTVTVTLDAPLNNRHVVFVDLRH